jgi:glycosyltransferase involved in cell wall biosynthesis
MASGLPVIMTPFVGLSRDFGEPEREYLRVDRHPEALATAIAKVLEDEPMGATLGRCARSWVEKTMDVERSMDRFATLYHELADRSRGSRLPS